MRHLAVLLTALVLAGCTTGAADYTSSQTASYDACAEFGYTPGTTLYQECDLHMFPFYTIYR
jgi:hypothetical protein